MRKNKIHHFEDLPLGDWAAATTSLEALGSCPGYAAGTGAASHGMSNNERKDI